MKIGAYILGIDQTTTPESISSVQQQVDSFYLIHNISPVNRAINTCLDQAVEEELDYLCILGADTIHYEDSIKTMMKYMKDDLWCVFGRLDDYYRGDEGMGNHLIQYEIL